MLVATFGRTTGWAGRTITFYEGQFTLEGHGFVTVHDVLEYDRQGHLLWAYDGLREWAYSLAPPPVAAPAVAMQAPARQAAAAEPAAGGGPVDMTAAPVGGPSAAADEAQATGAPGGVATGVSASDPAPATEPAAAAAEPAAAPAATMTQDLWRARCLDFDARVLAAFGAARDPGADVLARAARCSCWDFPPARPGHEALRAVTLYDRDGQELHTIWTGPGTVLPETDQAPPPPTPTGWALLDAPWAAMAVPPGWIGGAPEVAAAAAAATLQARGPEWTAWAGEWLTPLTTMYATSRGQLAALLFAVDAGAATLDEAAYAALFRQQLDAAHSTITLQWRTDDLSSRLGETGLVESVAYGTLAGRPASRLVVETRASFPHGPRGIHIVQYVFMQPPFTCSLTFTVPTATPERLGQSDRCAATFAYKS